MRSSVPAGKLRTLFVRSAAPSLLLWCLVSTAYAAGMPASGVYCRDSGRSVFAFRKTADGGIDLNATSNTPSGNSVLGFNGHAARVSDGHWLLGANADDPEDKCRADIEFTGLAWKITTRNSNDCADHHGAHGPWEMPIFAISTFARPAVKALSSEDCPAINQSADPGNGSNKDLDVPVLEHHGDGKESMCAATTVRGLKAGRDGFLSVRSGPGGRYGEIDRLHNGDLVFVVDEKIIGLV